MLCNRSLRCGLCRVAVCVEAVSLAVVAATIGHVYFRMCIVETVSAIVSVHCECPSTSLPSHGAIKVVQCYIGSVVKY